MSQPIDNECIILFTPIISELCNYQGCKADMQITFFLGGCGGGESHIEYCILYIPMTDLMGPTCSFLWGYACRLLVLYLSFPFEDTRCVNLLFPQKGQKTEHKF